MGQRGPKDSGLERGEVVGRAASVWRQSGRAKVII